MVRGKQGAWNPSVCLSWGTTLLERVKKWMVGSGLALDGARGLEQVKVGRVSFDPKDGVSFRVLDKEEVEEVESLEDRFGFLPRWYVNECWPGARQVKDSEKTGTAT